MNFGRVTTRECINEPAPVDPRCADPAFALAHPEVCGIQPVLVVKPSVVLACTLGSVQMSAVISRNGQEEDVTTDAVWTSSDLDVAVVGVHGGNATGLSAGEAIITATYADMEAHATITVLAASGDDCCEEQNVAVMVLIDTSKSMSLVFGSGYATRLAFAKAAAARFISEINETKDVVGLQTFNDADSDTLATPSADKVAVGALVTPILQTQQLTSFYTALADAIATLADTGADRQVILLISDGEDSAGVPYTDANNPITLLNDFKAAGGIVICLGVRASGAGFALLSNFSTGGFFLNAYSPGQATTLDYLSGLKGYVCAGNCTPTGDELVATGELNYTGWINWDVTYGTVDLIGNGYIDLLPGNGLYMDMAGTDTPQNGIVQTKNNFTLTSGHVYRLQFDLAGNNRADLGAQSLRVQVLPAGGGPAWLDQIITIDDYAQPFNTFSLNFTAPADGDVYLWMQQTEISANLTNARYGLLLDNVLLFDVTDSVILFEDTFDTENLTYIPPGCGTGTYFHDGGYDVGYNCYGDGCLDEPPPVQTPDPDPLGDVESGWTPPRIYTSTQEGCASCPEGTANYTTANLIPAMTGETTSGYSVTQTQPSPVPTDGYEPWRAFDGVGSWNPTTAPGAIQVSTPAPVRGIEIRITPDEDMWGYGYLLRVYRTPTNFGDAPIVSTTITFPASGEAVTFQFANYNECTGFLIQIIPTGSHQDIQIKQIEILGVSVPGEDEICAEATYESEISQLDADTQARAAAIEAAELQLNCIPAYTSTQQYTAHCAVGTYGQDVTRSATATSLISQEAADAAALAEAQADAEAALVCTGSNNNAAIVLSNEGTAPIPASPYPTVKYVEGMEGTITGMTVWLKDFSHSYPDDVAIMLRGPDGTTCMLMQRCGGSNVVSDLTLQISDDGTAMPDATALSSGHWQPTQYGVAIDFPTPAPAGPYGATLSVFNGKDPNGHWSLWAMDIAGADVGTLEAGWEIVFTTTEDTVIHALGDIRLDAADQVLAESFTDDFPAGMDAFLMLGDVVGTASTPAESWNYYDTWGFGGAIADVTMFTPGNHDWTPDGAAVKAATQAYWQAINGGLTHSLTSDDTNFNYAVKFGGWKIIVFNAEGDHDEAGTFSPGGTVYEFVSEELQEEGYNFILAAHMPRYSGDDPGVGHGDNASMAPLWALAAQYKAVAWIAGHSHFSEIQAQRNSVGTAVGYSGCASIVAGAGLASLYPVNPAYDPANVQYANDADNLMLVLKLNPSGITVYFIDTTGGVVTASRFRFPARN